MARYQKATSFTAGRKVTINGTTYQPGDAIPNAVVRGIKRLSALLGRGIIKPNVDIWRRRALKPGRSAPTDLGSANLRKDI